jgi:S-adenosylmethionine:tRNA ribosyltransferase-isomerase
VSSAVAFELPERLEAHEPPERRGLRRDDIRMLVARRSDGRLTHARFRDLADFVSAGDVLVINTSRTLPAALPARRADGATLDVHLSTPVPDGGEGRWVVELRRDGGRVRDGREGELLGLPDGGRLKLLAPYLPAARLWIAELTLPAGVLEYLARHGRPIRYRHVRAERPLVDYETVYATEPGSAEMPSAGRPFTAELITALVARGVIIAPLVLHAGVSSLEANEPPHPERFRVPASTARLVSAAREWGGRVIAIGTTSVRALETVALPDGSIGAGEGWTRVVVTPDRGVKAVDGLLTGWHEPAASHMLMLEAVAGPELVQRSYRAALAHGYLWHEFGDVHLILP